MRTVEQLVAMLTKHGVELLTGGLPETKVSAWLRNAGVKPVGEDPADPRFDILSAELGTIGIQVSARYDWDAARFVVRDWWTFNA